MIGRAGEYRTNLTGDLQYKSFLPKPLPPNPPVILDEDAVKTIPRKDT